MPKGRELSIVLMLGLMTAPGLAAQSDSPFVSTGQNTLHYNHEKLAWSSSGTTGCAATSPTTGLVVPVLRVADGEPFVIEFCRTDPRMFRYTISAIQEKEGAPDSSLETSVAVRTTTANLLSVQVVFRHNKVFRRYRVTAVAIARQAVAESEASAKGLINRRSRTREVTDVPAARDAVDLYGVAFDVLVNTKPEWELTISGGVAFSNLTSPRYYLKSDTSGTADTADDVTTVEEDPEGTDTFRPDIIALANVRPPTLNWSRDLGVSLGSASATTPTLGTSSAAATR
jgi:hypothetical protein